jgi:ligand-binding SRPBCC domain-containing protein
MKLHRLDYSQRLALSPAAAWAFFTDPANLAAITPPWLGFEITGPLPAAIYPGLIVSYRIRPLGGAAVTWVTEITQLQPEEFFVDEQRIGPYRFWHHQHHFRPCTGGVEVTDLVHYRMPFGPAGELCHRLLVERRLGTIFAFRRGILAARFGELP